MADVRPRLPDRDLIRLAREVNAKRAEPDRVVEVSVTDRAAKEPASEKRKP